jgi:tetratricopeptide (TPR) repeat protein
MMPFVSIRSMRHCARFMRSVRSVRAFALIAMAAITLAAASACHRGEAAPASASAPAAAPVAAHVVRAVEGAPDRLALLTMLREQRFDDLERELAEATRGETQNPDVEWRSESAFDAFDVADPAQLPLLDAWVAQMPTSSLALVARASHLVVSGYAARGMDSAVTSAQRAGMRSLHARAREDAEQAIKRDPTLVDAYIALLDIARAAGDRTTCETVTQQALHVVPTSYRVRASCLVCLLPRWAGNYERMQALAVAAQARASSNPRLPSLLGFVAWDQARLASSNNAYDRALDLLARAMAHGDDWRFYEARGNVYSKQKQYERALADYEQALRLHPSDPDQMMHQAHMLNALERPLEALTVLDRVSQFGSMDDDDKELLGNILERTVALAARRVKAGDMAAAHTMLDAVVARDPKNNVALYWNGRAFLLEQDFINAYAMFRSAVEANPGDFDSLQNLDYLLARSGEWSTIVQMWTTYLEQHPNDGRAFYERAGAYRRFDLTSGLADLRRACDLGVQDACRHLPAS